MSESIVVPGVPSVPWIRMIMVQLTAGPLLAIVIGFATVPSVEFAAIIVAAGWLIGFVLAAPPLIGAAVAWGLAIWSRRDAVAEVMAVALGALIGCGFALPVFTYFGGMIPGDLVGHLLLTAAVGAGSAVGMGVQVGFAWRAPIRGGSRNR